MLVWSPGRAVLVVRSRESWGNHWPQCLVIRLLALEEDGKKRRGPGLTASMGRNSKGGSGGGSRRPGWQRLCGRWAWQWPALGAGAEQLYLATGAPAFIPPSVED